MDSHFKSPKPPPFHRGVTRQIKPPNLQTSKPQNSCRQCHGRSLVRWPRALPELRCGGVYSYTRVSARAPARQCSAEEVKLKFDGSKKLAALQTPIGPWPVSRTSGYSVPHFSCGQARNLDAIRKLKCAGGALACLFFSRILDEHISHIRKSEHSYLRAGIYFPDRCPANGCLLPGLDLQRSNAGPPSWYGGLKRRPATCAPVPSNSNQP